MAHVTKEEHEVISYVCKFGCLDIEQLKILMQPLESRNVVTLVNCMIKKHMILFLGSRYLVPINCKISRPIVSCVWAMLQLTSSKEDFLESMRAVAPADIYFTVNRTDSFDVMYLDEGNLNKLGILQQRYIGKESSKKNDLIKTIPIFVVDDVSNKSLLQRIKDSGFSFPFILAIVAYGGSDRPTVRLAKSIPEAE